MKEINFLELKKPFSSEDIEWRLQSCGEKDGKYWGKCLAYVTNRAIQTRLDEVCGPENWKNEFKEGPNGGVLCGLSIRVNDEWVTKWDGAENTAIEAVKGGLSDAMKRVAVQWSIGRYLYRLEEGWAEVCDKGKYTGCTKDKKYFHWNPPTLPAWALPKIEYSADITERINKVRKFISENKIQKDFIPTAENYMAKGDKEGLDKVIAYVTEQEKISKSFDEKSA